MAFTIIEAASSSVPQSFTVTLPAFRFALGSGTRIHSANNGAMGPTYSSRLQWSMARNTLSVALEEHRRSGAQVLDLTQSNPTAAGFMYPPLYQALASSQLMQYEPAPRGLPSARNAFSEDYDGQ